MWWKIKYIVWKGAFVAIVKEGWSQDKRTKEKRRKENEEYEGMRSDQVGVTMTWPSREDAYTTDRRIVQAVALADSPS